MITYQHQVNMTPGRLPVRVKLNQYDDDWNIIFSLYTDSGIFTLESGTTAKIRGTKRDGLGYSANATINISAGTVTVAGDKQITAVAGDNLFELVLLNGTKELSTANIIFSVEPAAMDAGTLVSDSQVQEILDMSTDVIAASANVSTLRGNFAPAYSSSVTYVVGDYVMHDNQLYRCTTAITTAEAWTPAHWTTVSLGPAVSDLKSEITVKTDFTNHVISINGNYLDGSDLNIVGNFFNTRTGAIEIASGYSCGYIRFPCPGEYKLHQSVGTLGTNRLFVPLFKGDKTYYKSLVATAVNDYIISFSITDADADAVYIGVSYRPDNDPIPMLILDGDYPSSRTYTAPMYDFPDLKNMRYMGDAPVNLDTLVTGGWFSSISHSTHTTLPSDFNTSAGAIMVFPPLFNRMYAMQVLLSPNVPIKVWTRYVAMDGTSQSVWAEMPNRVDPTLAVSGVPADSAAVGNKIAEVMSYVNNISLSGNYFDYKNADWQEGYDTGTFISQTSGFHYAFVRLVGPGAYIRVMRNGSFGVNAARVALYDKNKAYIKYVSASRIESTDGFSFELTPDDAMTAVYTTVSYQDTYPNIVGLFYESDAYPLKAGLQAALPNYKPVSDPIYKSTFICDGDSICMAVADQPKYASGWWGRVILDYSADGKNYGVGGGTITSELYYKNGNPRHWINESIDAIRSEYPTLDYLILEGGTNDADLIGRFSGDIAPAKFGTWSDTDFSGNYDNETFCGAVDMMFYKAVTYWPKAKIGFIVAMQMGTNNASSANRRRYFDEIKAIAKKWHIPVLDLWDESQMDARLTVYYNPSMTSAENVAAGKCYYDGQHPTSYGYDLMQGKIDAWIHTL